MPEGKRRDDLESGSRLAIVPYVSNEAIQLPAHPTVSPEMQMEDGSLHRIVKHVNTFLSTASRWATHVTKSLRKQLSSINNNEAIQLPAPSSVRFEVRVEGDWLARIAQYANTTFRTTARWMTSIANTLPKARLSTIKDRAIQIWEPIYAGIKIEVAPQWSVPFPVSGGTRFLSRATKATTPANQWGWLPEIALLESFGLLILAWAFVEARAAAESAQLLLWIGLAVLILPVAVRLASIETPRRERIALVLLLGMALYLVKVMHSPIAFTFPDELSHVRNVGEILESHRLFQENPALPVTAFYPGLPIVTSALGSLSGLSVFTSGILVIGAARLILFLALYLLFEQIAGSARVASLATVFYMANPNFLYWTAEYAYESLGLPLLVFVLLMAAKREKATTLPHSRAWAIAALLGLFVVVIAHHMTSYILTGLLVAIALLSMILSRGKKWGPWQLALVALFATSLWLILIADLTMDYLSPVLGGAIRAIFRMISEEETSRALFSSSLSTERHALIGEQLVAVSSVVIIILGLPLGAMEIWRRHRNKALGLLLGAIAIAYVPVQMLRLTRAGWETANRSSEFLFIGVGFVLALGMVRFWLSHWTGWTSKIILGGLSVTLFFGGLIAGWPPRARLSRPYVVEAEGHVIRPQVVTVAEWVLEHLGRDNRIATSKADAKVMGAYNQYPFTDKGPVKSMFLSEEFGRSERKTLLRRDIQYIVSDRKNVSWDQMIGYYFYNRYSEQSSDLELIPPSIFEKFDGLEGISRILDSGDIVIYDVRMYLAEYKESSEMAKLEHTIIATPSTLPTTPLGPTNDHGEPFGNSRSSYMYLMAIPIPVPGCMWFTVQPNGLRINLILKPSTAGDESHQRKCLDWSTP